MAPEPFLNIMLSYEDTRFMEHLLLEYIKQVNTSEDCICICGADLITEEPCADDCIVSVARRLLARIQYNVPLPIENKIGTLV